MKKVFKFFKVIAVAVLAIIALVLIIALFVKKDYAITKDIVINKSQAEVYNYISKVKNQNEFGTWFKLDTAIKQTFSGVDGTVGFTSEWQSKNVGNGKQVITKVETGSAIETELTFFGPVDFKSKAKINATAATDSTTKVTWSMWGKSPYPFNAMNLFMSMEDVVGKDYSDGLANLKKVLETK